MSKPNPNKTRPRTRVKKNVTASDAKVDSTMRPGGKLGLILDRLEGKTGATLDELVDVTGWQKHSVRGALSRLRTRDFAIRLETRKGRHAYRLERAEV